MSEDSLSKENTGETPIFSPGDRVANKHGATGKIKGFEKRGDDDYVVIDMGDFTSKFPVVSFHNNFRRVLENERDRKSRTIDLRIKKYIENVRSHGDGVFSSQASDTEKDAGRGVEDIIEESLQNDFLFRCDLRTPNGDDGLFISGMHPYGYSDEDGPVVYTTTFLDIAMHYPMEVDQPDDPYHRYVYVIDPGGIKELGSIRSDGNDAEDDDRGEIKFPLIPADSIKYAIEYDEGENLQNIHVNPNFAY